MVVRDEFFDACLDQPDLSLESSDQVYSSYDLAHSVMYPRDDILPAYVIIL